MLVPRPDTETVVEAALDHVVRNGLRMERLRILDIGTGSGALLLALLNELPNALGTATDISTAALDVARRNAARHKLSDRCTFVACNVAAALPGPFDLIVSNPPYIARGDIATLAPEVRDYDPAIALDGGSDGLDFYRAIAGDARRLLAPGGRLIVELGIGQEPAVRALFTKAGLTVGAAAQRFGRNRARPCGQSARHERYALPYGENAGLGERRKNRLEYGAETTTFRSRNRPVTDACQEPRSQSLCEAGTAKPMTKAD